MAALPYIQLYVADYLADTMHLTTEEHGAYLLIIMNYWQTGKPIPKKRLASVARMGNDRWISVEDTLSEFFTETEQGLWIHARIEDDLAKVASKSTQASAAGKRSAAKRAESKVTVNKEDSNGRSNSVERKSNHTDTDTDTDTEADKDKDKELKDTHSNNLLPASVCVELMKSGIPQVNPSHPDLLAVIADGATMADFIYAATEAIQKGKGFAYTIAIVKNKIIENRVGNETLRNFKPNVGIGRKPSLVEQAAQATARVEARERQQHAVVG